MELKSAAWGLGEIERAVEKRELAVLRPLREMRKRMRGREWETARRLAMER